MKISFSNIGWAHKDDQLILPVLANLGFSAIEIAPSIIVDSPISHPEALISYQKQILQDYNLSISSMQSIWYKRTGNIFSPEDRPELLSYTKKLINLASSISCPNLVFGCPKNRIMSASDTPDSVIPFFKELGDYAFSRHTTLSLEPNPTIYGTNFINTTTEAFKYVKKVNSPGFKVNVDLGTIIYNEEPLAPLANNFDLINHIHISEPNLQVVSKRPLHQALKDLLLSQQYSHYLSVELTNPGSRDTIIQIASYVAKVFECNQYIANGGNNVKA